MKDQDVQPLTQQLAEFFNDPLHDPKTYLRTVTASGNYFPAWQLPPLASGDERCGGAGIGSNYFLLEPTNTNSKNGFPASPSFSVRSAGFTYHLQNVALLPWYLGASAPAATVYSFPDPARANRARPAMSRSRFRQRRRAHRARRCARTIQRPCQWPPTHRLLDRLEVHC